MRVAVEPQSRRRSECRRGLQRHDLGLGGGRCAAIDETGLARAAAAALAKAVDRVAIEVDAPEVVADRRQVLVDRALGLRIAHVLAPHPTVARLLAIRGRAIGEPLRLQETIDVVHRQQDGGEVLDQVLPEAAVRLAVDDRLHQPGDRLGRLPFARVDSSVDQYRALGKAFRGHRIGVAQAIGPDVLAGDGPTDDVPLDHLERDP